MGLFDKILDVAKDVGRTSRPTIPTYPGDPIGNLRDTVETAKKLKTVIFTDSQLEGGKIGIKRAAQEYDHIYNELVAKFEDFKNMCEEKNTNSKARAEMLITELESLEKQRDKLLAKRKQYEKKICDSNPDIAIATGLGSTVSAVGQTNMSIIGPLVDLLYKRKMKKIDVAAQQKYEETKALYERKIAALKDEMAEAKKRFDDSLQENMKVIEEILFEIASIKADINELQFYNEA